MYIVIILIILLLLLVLLNMDKTDHYAPYLNNPYNPYDFYDPYFGVRHTRGMSYDLRGDVPIPMSYVGPFNVSERAPPINNVLQI